MRRSSRESGVGTGPTVSGDTSDTGGGGRRPVPDQHAVRTARVLPQSVGTGRPGVGADLRAGDGMPADQEEFSGGRTGGTGRQQFQTGIFVPGWGDGGEDV